MCFHLTIFIYLKDIQNFICSCKSVINILLFLLIVLNFAPSIFCIDIFTSTHIYIYKKLFYVDFCPHFNFLSFFLILKILLFSSGLPDYQN